MTKMFGRFRCNLCGSRTESNAPQDERESSTCGICGSSARFRAIALALSRTLFGFDLTLPEFPLLKSVRGLGISDSEMISSRLDRCFTYINTYYHREPVFDLMRPDEREFGRYDFVICADVLEHVPAPVETAFRTLSQLLKPGGFVILTVPYTLDPETVEHFPDPGESGLAEVGGKTVLISRAAGSGYRVYDQLTFHGGAGSTLERRIYSEQDLRAKFAAAGLSELRVETHGNREFGVAFAGPCSLPLVASREPFALGGSGIAELMVQLVSDRKLLGMVRESRWMRIGRMFGAGPRLAQSPRL
jgi:SAM-dependent methyltransferase